MSMGDCRRLGAMGILKRLLSMGRNTPKNPTELFL